MGVLLMMFGNTLREHQDEIMDEFDFGKVRSVMEFLDWQWGGAEDGVPTQAEMRKWVRDLMAQAYEYATKSGRNYWISSGGFVVKYDVMDDAFDVYFKLEGWNTDGLEVPF
jgi:hypothetical protein